MNAAAILSAQAQAFDAEADEANGANPSPWEGERRDARRILRREAHRLATLAPRSRKTTRTPALRIGAATPELLEAFTVLASRVDELTTRLDEAYEAVERDEAERERLLEALESAAHDTMDWSAEEQHDEGADDDSTDDEDADIEFAASVARGGGPLRTTTLPERTAPGTRARPKSRLVVVARLAPLPEPRAKTRARVEDHQPSREARPPAYPDGVLRPAKHRLQDFPLPLLRELYGREPEARDMIFEAVGHRMPEDLPHGSLVFAASVGDGFEVAQCDYAREYVVRTSRGVSVRRVALSEARGRVETPGMVFLCPPSRYSPSNACDHYPPDFVESSQVRVLGVVVARFTFGEGIHAVQSLHAERAAIVRSLKRAPEPAV